MRSKLIEGEFMAVHGPQKDKVIGDAFTGLGMDNGFARLLGNGESWLGQILNYLFTAFGNLNKTQSDPIEHTQDRHQDRILGDVCRNLKDLGLQPGASALPTLQAQIAGYPGLESLSEDALLKALKDSEVTNNDGSVGYDFGALENNLGQALDGAGLEIVPDPIRFQLAGKNLDQVNEMIGQNEALRSFTSNIRDAYSHQRQEDYTSNASYGVKVAGEFAEMIDRGQLAIHGVDQIKALEIIRDVARGVDAYQRGLSRELYDQYGSLLPGVAADLEKGKMPAVFQDLVFERLAAEGAILEFFPRQAQGLNPNWQILLEGRDPAVVAAQQQAADSVPDQYDRTEYANSQDRRDDLTYSVSVPLDGQFGMPNGIGDLPDLNNFFYDENGAMVYTSVALNERHITGQSQIAQVMDAQGSVIGYAIHGDDADEVFHVSLDADDLADMERVNTYIQNKTTAQEAAQEALRNAAAPAQPEQTIEPVS